MGSSQHKPRARELACDPDAPPRFDFEQVKLQHTKVLLGELRRMRAQVSMTESSIKADAEFGLGIDTISREKLDVALQYIGQLKDELATREHVPNKQEARKLRQERAKRR